jgi:hypothetical protein
MAFTSSPARCCGIHRHSRLQCKRLTFAEKNAMLQVYTKNRMNWVRVETLIMEIYINFTSSETFLAFALLANRRVIFGFISLPKDVQTITKPSIISEYDKCFHVDSGQ